MKKNKLLLVQALSMEGPGIEKVYPLGLVTIATYLNKTGDYELKLLDLNLEADPYAALHTIINDFEPDGVGISFRNVDPLGNRTNSLVVPLMLTADYIRERIGNRPFFIGGTGYSLFAERLLDDIPALDYGFSGEAEDYIVPYTNAIMRGQTPTQPGSVIRKNGRAVLIPRAPGFDMRRYQAVDRTLLDPQRYLALNAYVESIGVETKRGCAFGCAYCSYPLLQGAHMRLRDPEDVADELENLVNTYNVPRVHFTDPIVNFPADHFDAVCQAILRRGISIKWSGFFREDTLTPERAALYTKAGCECFSLSPDGLTQASLDALGKRLTLADIRKTAKILSETGVTCVYHFLVNTPACTPQTIKEAKETIDAIYDIHGESKTLGTIVLNLIRILPDTPIEQTARSTGVINDGTDLLYPVYYDPAPYQTLRYGLEVYHQAKNIRMWQQNN